MHFASSLAEAVSLEWRRDCAVPSVFSNSFVPVFHAPSLKEHASSLWNAFEGSLERAVSVQCADGLGHFYFFGALHLSKSTFKT